MTRDFVDSASTVKSWVLQRALPDPLALLTVDAQGPGQADQPRMRDRAAFRIAAPSSPVRDSRPMRVPTTSMTVWMFETTKPLASSCASPTNWPMRSRFRSCSSGVISFRPSR
jgi:hypothetical protein